MLKDAAAIRTFALAGNATLTAKSLQTGKHFTYKVRASKDKGDGKPGVHFVKVLCGPDNENAYVFLGTIFSDGKFKHSPKSYIGPDAPSTLAFRWVWEHTNHGNFPPKTEVHHAGKCGRCGRKLTVPESITTGLGPECASKMGL